MKLKILRNHSKHLTKTFRGKKELSLMQTLMKKDLKKKKVELIEIDSKYFETEKLV